MAGELRRQGAYASIEAAFVTAGGVFVHQALSGQAIDNRAGRAIGLLCAVLILGGDGPQDFLDLRTHERAPGGVVRAVLFRLPGTLLSL